MTAPIQVRVPRPPVQLLPHDDCEALVRDFLSAKAPTTLVAYESDLRHLAEFLGVAGPAEAARAVLASHREANQIALRWKGEMDGRLSPSMVNRRLSALRSLVKLARVVGLVTWAIDVGGVKVTPYRDLKAVTWAQYQEGLAREGLTLQDRTILRLMGDRGLRVSEVAGLDLADVVIGAQGAEEAALWVRGKGRGGQRELLTLAPETARDLLAWVEERGSEPGPLFVWSGVRYNGSRIYALCKRLGWRPHALRHCSITRALDRLDGDVRRVAKFARHANVRTTLHYDDAREDFGGQVAREMQG